MTDITEHPTREGKVYCAVVLDAYSRKVVGWSIDPNQETSLAINALGMPSSTSISCETPSTARIRHRRSVFASVAAR